MNIQNNSLNLGIWQGVGVAGDVGANILEINRVIKLAVKQKVDLLVFPECFLTGYVTSEDVLEVAGRVDDMVIEQLGRISIENGITMVVGSYELTGRAACNSAFVLHPEIGLIGPYRKRMLYGDWEKRTFYPGTQPLLFSWKGLKIGVLICYDIEFPEMTRELARLGADLIVTPTALMAPYKNVAWRLVPARAMENGIFVGYANRIGRELDLNYVGSSCIIAPDGDDIARASESQTTLLTAQISRTQRDKMISIVDYLADMPPPKTCERSNP